jgi:hypothetical protein
MSKTVIRVSFNAVCRVRRYCNALPRDASRLFGNERYLSNPESTCTFCDRKQDTYITLTLLCLNISAKEDIVIVAFTLSHTFA